MSDETKKEEHHQTLLHDDQGNIDDRRVAGWVTLITGLVIAGIGVWREASFTAEVLWPILLAATTLFGVTIAEKFAQRGQR